MLKIIIPLLTVIIFGIFGFKAVVSAEEIHFDNSVFILKYSAVSPETNGYENEYFLKNENRSNWTKMTGLYHYPDIDKPIKYASDISKQIESEETDVLLKLIENKKTSKAALSYLQNGSLNGKKYFEYNIYRYEKHPQKGMLVLRYAIRYFFETDDEITQIGQKVRAQNDEYLEKIIIPSMPQLVEKEIKN